MSAGPQSSAPSVPLAATEPSAAGSSAAEHSAEGERGPGGTAGQQPAVAVMGSGSWGTTFAQVVADAGTPVMLWSRREEVARAINEQHRNPDYLGELRLPTAVRATTDPAEALRGAAFVVLAVPAQSLRDNLAAWRELMPAGAVLISLMKGIERSTGLRMSQVIASELGWPSERIAVVSGPNLAIEIAGRQPTATVVAASSLPTAEAVAGLTANAYFRPYTNEDVIGVEFGGAVKNVIALAVGMASGLGLGDNSKASIITRGLAETTRLALAAGGRQQTLAGLAGLGDLVATCVSPLSRNRTVGELLGQGLSLDEVVRQTKQTAEGVKSCAAILALGEELGIDLPITEAVVNVLDGRLPVAELPAGLLSRKLKSEHQ